MDVRDLAPALLALGEIIHEVQSVANPDEPQVGLEIRSLEQGSFDLFLSAYQALQSDGQQVMDFLKNPNALALEGLIGVVGGPTGIFAFVKWLKGKQGVHVEEGPGPGQTVIVAANNDRFVTDQTVVILSRDPQVRGSMKDVIKPLNQPGIENVQFFEPGSVKKPATTIERDDVDAFDVPSEVEIPVNETQYTVAITAVAPSFSEGNAWMVNDGARTFYARVEDKDFLDRIERGEVAFRKGDILRCRMRLVQSQVSGKLRTEYYVQEVLEHVPRVVGTPLQFPI